MCRTCSSLLLCATRPLDYLAGLFSINIPPAPPTLGTWLLKRNEASCQHPPTRQCHCHVPAWLLAYLTAGLGCFLFLVLLLGGAGEGAAPVPPSTAPVSSGTGVVPVLMTSSSESAGTHWLAMATEMLTYSPTALPAAYRIPAQCTAYDQLSGTLETFIMSGRVARQCVLMASWELWRVY